MPSSQELISQMAFVKKYFLYLKVSKVYFTVYWTNITYFLSSRLRSLIEQSLKMIVTLFL